MAAQSAATISNDLNYKAYTHETYIWKNTSSTTAAVGWNSNRAMLFW
mgnify:CR=1 FL=1